MKRTGSETKSKKSAESFFKAPKDSFFEDEHSYENEALSFAGSAELLKPEDEKGWINKYKTLISLLKQIFLFLPGTFFLYFVGFVGAIILMDILYYQRPWATLPPSLPAQLMMLTIIGFLGTLMTWFGLGNIKNKKHLAIPTSIFVTSALIAVILKAIENLSDAAVRILEDFNHYFFYLPPLMLVIPVLTKGIVDRREEEI